MSSGLLPEGLRDRLPGEAEAQAGRLRAMLDAITGSGYARVAPPLAEYEDELVARQGTRIELARFVDPLTKRTLAIRSDITPQIARIAQTTLKNAARPLRLGYAGTVLKLGTGQLDAGRESLQVGAELIGVDDVDAAVEIVRTALVALAAAGVAGVTVDLTLPDLITTALPGQPRAAELDRLLDIKDAGGLAAAGFAEWVPLLDATGLVEPALARLRAFDGGSALAQRVEQIAVIVDALKGRARLTLDPTERHGFEYQSWFGFSLFAPVAGQLIGRGGSYMIGDEPAVGFSLYPDTVEGSAWAT